MAAKQYTVKDDVTGKIITFEWEGGTPPTEKDMRDIFMEARKTPLEMPGKGFMETYTAESYGGEDPYAGEQRTRHSGDWMPESFGGIPKWGLQNPRLWGLRGAGLELYDVGVQPILEALGMVGGSFGSPVAGTALGYGIGKKTGEIGRGFLSRAGMPESLHEKQRTVGEEMVRSAVDVAQPLVMGAGFRGAAKLIQPVDEKITAAIKKGIDKGIRPTVVGKRTFPQTEAYYKRAETAVKTIVRNKENLNLTDEFGEIVPGLPKNLKQFSQAIDSTKRVVFSQYDALQKATGRKGELISLEPAVRELRALVNQRAVQLTSPSSAGYAMQLIKRFTTKRGPIIKVEKVTTAEAQQMIARLNNSLEAFYKNPSYHTAQRAYVDSIVANNLRKSLDRTILKATGKQYQVLKNQYGALKAIEKEVNHRAIVDARKNVKGLIDFSDIFTGYHAAKGILSMDPATIGAAGAGKTVAWLYRARNQPNRIIRSMFKDVEKYMKRIE